MTEADFQKKVITYLKRKGCYVVKTTPGQGVPTGCPDILFFYDGFWGAIEAKSSAKAKFQPLQKVTLQRLNDMSWARAVYPENWAEVKVELDILLS